MHSFLSSNHFTGYAILRYVLAVLSEDVAGALGSLAADVPAVFQIGAAVVATETEVASPEMFLSVLSFSLKMFFRTNEVCPQNSPTFGCAKRFLTDQCDYNFQCSNV